MVHIYSVKEKIPTVPKEELPDLKKIVKERGYLALPLIILIYLLVAGYSPGYAVVRCIGGILIVCWVWALMQVIIAMKKKPARMNAREIYVVWKRENQMGLRRIWDALVQGSLQATIVAVAIITSGIMVGIFDLTGVAVKFSGLLVDFAGGSLFLALVFIMLTSIVLGMGLPLSSAYIIQVGIAIPALITMMKSIGLPEKILVPQAHLFVIFFSAFSAITPPTAPTSYAAAAIARSPDHAHGHRGHEARASGVSPAFHVRRGPVPAPDRLGGERSRWASSSRWAESFPWPSRFRTTPLSPSIPSSGSCSLPRGSA